MTPQELRTRTAVFAVDVARLMKTLDRQPAARVVTDQLLRSATSTAANYRAAGLARSHREFISKISQVLEEADESIHWLEFLRDAEVTQNERLAPLIREAR
jgi:four helix bundle protein